MVKHTISNNQCYVLVMCGRFLSEDSLEKIVFDNLGRKPQKKPLPIETMGRGFLASDCVCGGYIA